ncbi:hypothetical protein [Lewinella sp. LCG006]|uniref:DUF6985 domain-containing protein n=1 Tax=Lewinella sp. LCG006 TaxID=3231911 RepID=UPI0034600EB1
MKKIDSKEIGELLQNEEFDDWWESEPIQIPLLENKALKITLMDFVPEEDDEFLAGADNTLKNFLSKKEEERFDLSDLVYKNCMEFLNAIGYDEMDKALWEIKNKNEIWKYVYPQEIHITRRHRRDEDVYLSIICECEWEQEHGLQLVFRRGKQITRISSQDGHLTEADAYDKLDEEDELLSKFKGN